MLFFKTRDGARDFAHRTGRQVTDLGETARRRWGVQVLAA